MKRVFQMKNNYIQYIESFRNFQGALNLRISYLEQTIFINKKDYPAVQTTLKELKGLKNTLNKLHRATQPVT